MDPSPDTSHGGNIQQPSSMPGIPTEFAFEQQQQQLAQLRDMLQKNQQTISTTKKEKENYAATLSRIRMQRRGKGTQRKREEDGESFVPQDAPDMSQSLSSTEYPKTPEPRPTSEKSTTPGRVKVNLLQQQVEQTSLAEQLNVQLPELDSSSEMADSSTSGLLSPTPSIDLSSDKSREFYAQIIQKDNKIGELNNRILELERDIMDYQENLREKDELLDAKARSVALITEDMSRRNKTTVDALEETRQEMRAMQKHFVEAESKLKDENNNLKTTLASKEQRLSQLESLRFDLNARNAELQQKVVTLQTRRHEVLAQGLPADKERIAQLEEQLDQLQQTGAPGDKARIEQLEKQLEETSKQSESAEQELQQLQNRIAELEEEKGNLQLNLVDFDELKSNLVEQLDSERKAKAEVETQLEDTTKNILIVESALQELKVRHEHSISSLQQEVESLKVELVQSRGEADQVKHELSAAQEELMSKTESYLADQLAWGTEKEKLGSESDSLQQQLQSREEELGALRVTVEMQGVMGEEAERWKCDLAQKNDEIQTLTQQLERSTMELSVYSTESERTKELESKISELSCSLSEMQAIKVEQAEAVFRTQQAISAKEAEHQAEVESLEMELQKKQQRASDLEEQLSGAVESKQELQQQFDQLQQELSELRRLKQDSESVVEQLSQRISQMEEQLRCQVSEKLELTEQLQHMQQTISDRDHSLSVMQNTVRDLKRDVDAKNEALTNAGQAEQLVASLQTEVIQLQRKLQDETMSLRQRAEQAEDELAAAFSQAEHSSKDHRAVQEQWYQERETLHSQLLEVQEGNNSLEEIISTLKDNVSSLQVQLSVAIGEREAADSELGNLKESLQHFQLLKEQHEVYIRQITELQMELSQEQQLNVTTVQALRDENNNLKSQLQQSNNYVSQLQAQLSTEHQNISTQIHMLQEENKLLTSTKEELSDLYAELHRNFFELQQQKDTDDSNVYREKQTMSEELSKSRSVVEDFRTLLSSSESALDKAKVENSVLHSEVETLQTRLQKLVSLQEDVSVRKTEVTTLESKLTDSHKENMRLQSELEQRDSSYAEIVATNNELKAALNEREKSSKENLNHLNSELESQRNQVKRLECVVADYLQQIQEFESIKSKNNEYIVSLSSEMEGNQNYIQLLQNTVADVQSKLQAMQKAEVEQAENYMALTTQMKSSEEANTSLQEEIQGLHRIMEEHPVWQESGDEARELRLELQAMEQERIRLLAEVEMYKVQAGPKLNVPDTELQAEMEALQTEVGVLRRELEAAREEAVRREHDVVTGWEEPESWGDGTLEEQHQQTMQQQQNSSEQLLVAALQAQLSEAEAAQTKLQEELRASQVRCGKLIKQVKSLKEQTSKQQPSDLDKVLEDELQSQLMKLRKEMEEVQAEKASLLARADTLTAANERLIDMKEQQDLELERSRAERAALAQQLSGLQEWQPDNETNSQRILHLEAQLQQARDRCVELGELLEQRMGDQLDSSVSVEQNASVAVAPSSDTVAPSSVEPQISVTVAPEQQASATVAPSLEASVMVKPATTEMGVVTDPLENTPVSEEPVLRTQLEAKMRELKAREEEHHSLAAYIAQLRGALEAKSAELASLENHPREAELKTELDSALYMLHQRDVRCDELTLELMALMEERDTLQLRLSSALRLNEQQRVAAVPAAEPSKNEMELSQQQQQELHSK
ncbi:hypothetical protein B566_EDAN002820 [Ephemera danica]|nr:hypothetical protein B566_EDAN002820 [Ephemera danica]